MSVPPNLPIRRVGRRVGSMLVVAAVMVAGCGVTHVDAPILTVVTSVYPLAQAVEAVGAAQVKVVDLARADVDPRTMVLTPAQVRQVHDASLVVDVGDGFEPSVEAAAKGAPHVLQLLPAMGGTNPYIWLDPHLMERVGTLLQTALTRREPAARAVFTDGEEVLASELQSLDIDYQNSLSDCPHKTFVTADDAFSRLATRYDVTDHAAGSRPVNAVSSMMATNPDANTVRAVAAAISATGTVTAFTEPYVARTTLTAAANLAGVKVRSLNTLVTPPASGSPATVTYSNMMEEDLTSISGALQCASIGQN
jgi:zinc transport system substrate-binding protein